MDKRKRLSEISNEIQEMHPIIDMLLQRIPDVIGYEKTHGPNEMGADFVFISRKEILNQEIYTGVICKVGEIRQDYSELERQIKECRVSRYAWGGKRTVRLDEIWIVCTGRITENAKRKIQASFSGEAI